MKRNAPRVNNPARLARLRDQAIKLRERVKRSTLAFLERNQARFTWWKRAFRVPMVADWAIFANAKTLLSAFMALLGLASGKKSSLVAFMVAGPSPQTSRNRRRLHVEGLEQRQLMAADFPEFVDPRASFSGNQFGHTVVALNGGNVVITSPFDDAGGTNAGAVYLFNGKTGALISTLTGSKANDNVGIGGVTALSNGNYVVMSPSWDNGAVVDAGAATFGSGTTGFLGAVVSATNSLVGSTGGDMSTADVTALSNGSYVVRSPLWNNGTVVDVGAVTFGGLTGVSGAISAANSLVGSTTGDMNFGSVTALSNGSYVVNSWQWDNGALTDLGAVTFGKGTEGVKGAISATNSLVGTISADQIGRHGVTALKDGSYVVSSAFWDNGVNVNAGAVTFGDGTAGVSGPVTAANSLVGTNGSDSVGINGVSALNSGNYVVSSPLWRNVGAVGAGAVTFGDASKGGIKGPVTATNSLVGTRANDNVGSSQGAGIKQGVTALKNGGYLVMSPLWNRLTVVDAGAVTFGDGMAGVSGPVSDANSLVGSTDSDKVGSGGVTELSNGSYVVISPLWNSPTVDAGAVTFVNGTTGVSGVVVSLTNSLVGTRANDNVGSGGVTALSNGINDINGNYVVMSPLWDSATVPDAGAVTFGNGTTGAIGVVVSDANSLVGTSPSDLSSGDVTALSNGSYVVRSPLWNNGTVVDVGAVTFGGLTGVSGTISATNSLVGSAASDGVGSGGVTALSTGNYVVTSPNWDNGAVVNAGAITFGSGLTGVSGAVLTTNRAIGGATNTSLQTVVVDDKNDHFFGRFLSQFGGRVRLGSQLDGFAPSVNLSVSASSGTEAGRTAITVTATASTAVSGSQTVKLGVAGTNITTGDYLLSGTTITIPDGQTTGSVTFTIKDDSLVEAATETAILTISNPSSGLTLGTTTSRNITITDNDTATASINNPLVIETNSGTTLLVFTVSLDKPVDVAVTATTNTADGTTTDKATLADSDYVAITNGTVTFSAGSTSQTVNVTINGDRKVEPNEQLRLVLSALSAGGPSGRSVQFSAAAATSTGIGTIVDDDLNNAAPVLTVNDTSRYVEDAVPILVAPTLTLTTGQDVTGATVSLTNNFNSAQDSLQFTNQNGISGSYNAETGILILSGIASAATYQTALRSVTYSNNSQDPSIAARSVQFSIGSNLANPANGHFYEFVAAPGGTWTSAKAGAESRTFFGLQGYLATVTSASENAFIAGKLNGQGWMGASDAALEGTWKWMTGPEAGHPFWQGGKDGSAVNGMYNNWTPKSEPNNSGDEHYAHFRIDTTWNDYKVDSISTQGYVVEYGGMSGDPTLQLVGSASVIVVAVNDAPSGANKTLKTNEDSQLTIVAADFGFSDVAENHAFSRVQITALPTAGTLTLNGVAMSAGDFATKAQLDANQLTFNPVANANGSPYTGFTFQVEDAGGTADGGFNLDATPNTITINVLAINDLPVAQASSVISGEKTPKSFSVSDFLFTDVERDSLASITISSLTLASGDTLKLSGTDVTVGQVIPRTLIPNLVYTPADSATGAEVSPFGFTVNDAGSGTVSASMTINFSNDFVYHAPLLFGWDLDVFVRDSADRDKAVLVVRQHNTNIELMSKKVLEIAKLVDIKTTGNVYIPTGLWTDGDEVRVTASNIEAKGKISTVSNSDPKVRGNLTLIARNKSNDIVSGITGALPIFIETRSAAISLTNAELFVGAVEIKAEGQSGARWDDVGGIGEKIAGSLLSQLQALPQIALTLSELAPLSGQAKVHTARANITLADATIDSNGNVAIGADAFADASTTAISLGGKSKLNIPVSISIAFSHSFSEATIQLNGKSKIDATGNIKISTDSETKSKVDAKSDANTGDQEGIEFAFNLALAMTEENSTIIVSKDTQISSFGSVDITSKAKVKNESKAATSVFKDGTGALTVALGFDNANVKTEVHGQITSSVTGKQGGFAVAVGQVSADTRRIELKNVQPSDVVNEGDRVRFESDAVAGAYGLVPGETYIVEGVTNSAPLPDGKFDQSFRLRRGEVVSLDARQVSEGSKHSLRTIDLAYFNTSDVTVQGIVKLEGLPAGVTKVTYRGPKFMDSQSSSVSDEVLVGIEGLIQDQDYQIVPATGGGYHLRLPNKTENVQFKVPTVQPQTEQPLTDEQKKQIHAFAYSKNIQTFEPAKKKVVDPKANTILLADGHGFKTGDFVIYETDDKKTVEKEVHYYDEMGIQKESLGTVKVPDAPIDGLGNYRGYRVIVDPSNPNLIRLSSVIQMEKIEGKDGSATPTYQTIADTVVLNKTPVDGNHRLVPLNLVQGINISSSLEAENTSEAGSVMSDDEQPATELASNALSGRLGSIATGGMTLIKSLREKATTNAVADAATQANTESGSKTNFDVAGSFALNLFKHNVSTTIGSSARLASSSDLTVDGKIEQKAQLKASAEATRNGVGKADGTVTAKPATPATPPTPPTTPPTTPPPSEKADEIEIAAAVAVGVYSNGLKVTVTDGAKMNAADDLQVNAKIEYPLMIDSANPLKSFEEKGLASFEDILDGSGGLGQMFNVSVATLAGTASAKLALGGGIAVTYVTNEVTAEIGKNVLVNQSETEHSFVPDPTQSVTVTAELTAKMIEVGQQSSFNLNLDGGKGVSQKIFSKDYAKALNDVAVPLGVSGKNAMGGVMVLSIVDNDVKAKIHDAAKVKAKDRVSVDAKNAYSNISVVQTGTASTDFGFTAAIAVGVFDLATVASIGEGVSINTDNLTVNAQDESDRIAILGGFLKGKQVGIGTSIGVNIVDQQVDAFIGRTNPTPLTAVPSTTTISPAKKVNVTATTKGEIFALVMAGAAQGGRPDKEKPDKPQPASNGTSQTTVCPSYTKVNKDGKCGALPKGTRSTPPPPPAPPTPPKQQSKLLGPVALTIPVALNFISSDVKAYVDRQKFQTESVNVEALTELSVLQIVVGASFAVQMQSADPAVANGKLTLGGAGAVALAIIQQDAIAFIKDSHITATGADAVTVKATDKSSSDIYAGGIGVAGNFAKDGKAAISFGASVAINQIDGATKAYMENSTIIASGTVNVIALGESKIFSLSMAGGASVNTSNQSSGAFGGGGTVSINDIEKTIEASILSNTKLTVTAVMPTVISARDESQIFAIAGAAGISVSASTAKSISGALGIALAINEINNTVAAKLDRSTVVTSGNLIIDANSQTDETKPTSEIKSFAVAASVGVSKATGVSVSLAGAGAGSLNDIQNTSAATLNASKVTLQGTGTLIVLASDGSKIESVAIGASISAAKGQTGVAVAVGASLGINEIQNTVQSVIALGTVIDSQAATLLKATSNSTIDAVAAAASVAVGVGDKTGVAVSGAGAAAKNVILSKTNAYIENSTLNTAGTVDIDAHGTSKINAKVISASVSVGAGDSAGVGASVGVAVARNFIGWKAADDTSDYTTDKALDKIQTGTKVKVLGGVYDGDVYEFIGKAPIVVYHHTNSGSVALKENARVKVGPAVYRFKGQDGTRNLSTQNYETNTNDWELIGESDLSSQDFGKRDLWKLVLTSNAATIQAYIQNSTITATGAVTLDALAKETVDAIVIAGSVAVAASSKVGVAFSGAGVGTENRIRTLVKAYVDSGRFKVSASDLTIKAHDTASIKADAGAASVAVAAGGKVGVSLSFGVALAFNEISNEVAAYIANSVSVTTTGNVVLEASSHGGSPEAENYTSKQEGQTALKLGDRVKLEDSHTAGGKPGQIYSYRGLPGAVDLQKADYSDTSRWELADASIRARTGAASIAASFGEKAGVAVSGAGAFAQNVINTKTNATIQKSTLKTGGQVTLDAVSDASISAIVGAVSVAVGIGGKAGVGVSIGAAIALNNIGSAQTDGNFTSEVLAYVDQSKIDAVKSLTLSATGNQNIDAIVLAGSVAAAASDAAGVGVSAAGAVAINEIGSHIAAYLTAANLVAITAEKISLSAHDLSTISSFAGAASIAAALGGKAGVAVSVGVALASNEIHNKVETFINKIDVTPSAGDIILDAKTSGAINAISAAASVSIGVGGKAGVAVSGAGAVAKNIILSKTDAFIDGSKLVTSGKVDIDALNSSKIDATIVAASVAVGVGDAAGVGASVGVAVARNFIGWKAAEETFKYTTDSTVRTIPKGTTVKVLGGVYDGDVVEFIGKDPIVVYEYEHDRGGSVYLKENDRVKVGPAVYRFKGDEGSRHLTVSSQQYETNEDWELIGESDLSGQDFGKRDLWKLVLPDTIEDAATVRAYIRNSTITATGVVTLDAVAKEAVEAIVIAGSVALAASSKVGVAFSGAGVGTENRIRTLINAYVDKSTVSAAKLLMNAHDTAMIKADAGSASVAGSAAGKVGVSLSFGVALAFNEISNEVAAYIANSSNVTTTEKIELENVVLNASSRGGSPEAPNFTSTQEGQTALKLGDRVMVAPNHTAGGKPGRIYSYRGLFGLPSSVDLQKADYSETLFWELADASISARTGAASIAASFGGAAAIAVSGAGAFAENEINTKTNAYIHSSKLTTAGEVKLNAESDASISAIVAAVSAAVGVGGKAGVGVSIGAAIAINNIGAAQNDGNYTSEVLAYADLSNINAAKSLTLSAKGGQNIDAIVLAGSVAAAGGGVAGVGVSAAGAVAINEIGSHIAAYIKGPSLSGIQAESISLLAQDISTISTIAGAASIAAALGGKAGVAVSVGVALASNEIHNKVEAYIEKSDVLAQTGNIILKATNGGEINAKTAAASLAIAGGGIAGVAVSGAGALSKNEINNRTLSRIVNSTTRATLGSLSVTAEDTATIDGKIIAASVAAAGGLVGVGVALGLSSVENIIPATALTQAMISGGQFTAGGTVEIKSTSTGTMNSSVNAASIGFAAGGVGVAAAVAGVLASHELKGTVEAQIANSSNLENSAKLGFTVDASNTITSNLDVKSASVAAAVGVGFAGTLSVSASSATTTVEPKVLATISNAKLKSESGNIQVTAKNIATVTNDAATAALAVSAGSGISVAGGGASSTVTAIPKVHATIQDSDLIGKDITVSDSSTDTIKADSKAAAISISLLGLGASGSISKVTLTPDLMSEVARTKIVAKEGTLTINTLFTPVATAESAGLTVSTGAAVGVSNSDVTINGSLVSRLDPGNTNYRPVDVGALSISSENKAANADGLGSSVKATGASGGLLVGANGAIAKIANTTKSTAEISDNNIVGFPLSSNIAVKGKTSIHANSATSQMAEAGSLAAGLLSSGNTLTEAKSDNATTARIGKKVRLTTGELDLQSFGKDDNSSSAKLGSFGGIGIALSKSETITTSVTKTIIDDLAEVTVSGKLDADANQTSKYHAKLSSLSGGIISGSGGVVNNTIDSIVNVNIGNGTKVTAETMDAIATNKVEKNLSTDNDVDATAGGLIAGVMMKHDTTLKLNTTTTIGTNAKIVLTAEASPPSVTIATSIPSTPITPSAPNRFEAFQDIKINDKLKFLAGGLAAGGALVTNIKSTDHNIGVNVGAGAQIDAKTPIHFAANENVIATIQANSEAYGAATLTGNKATIDFKPQKSVKIEAGANIFSTSNVVLLAGMKSNLENDDYEIKSNVDAYAGALLPLDQLDSNALLHQKNTIEVLQGAKITSGGEILLSADDNEFQSISAQGKSVNWMSSISTFFSGGSSDAEGGVGQFAGDVSTQAEAIVTIAGTLKTGAGKDRILEIVRIIVPADRANLDAYQVQLTPNSNIPVTLITKGNETVGSPLADQLHRILGLLETLNSDDDQELKDYYQREVVRLQSELRSRGLFKSLPGVPDIVVSQTVLNLILPNITASSGAIRIDAKNINVTGTLLAPSDPKIKIINNSDAYIATSELTIPEHNGGVFYNGRLQTARTTKPSILVANQAIVNIGETIENGQSIAWPGITVTQQIKNLSGDVTLTNVPAGSGSINLKALIQSASQTIKSGLNGTLTIGIAGADSVYELGGSAYAQLEGMTNGYKSGISDVDGALRALKMPNKSGLTAGTIVLSAAYINVNGLIESGRTEYTLDFTPEMEAQAAEFSQTKTEGLHPLTNNTNDAFIVQFDAKEKTIVVENFGTSGGNVEIHGHVANTGAGKIQVASGFASVKVTGASAFPIKLNDIDLSRRAAGRLLINDTYKPGIPTIYESQGNQITKGGTVVSSLDGTDTYQPMVGLRYRFVMQEEENDVEIKKVFRAYTGGIDHWAKDPPTQITTEIEPQRITLLDTHFFVDTGVSSPFTYESRFVLGAGVPSEEIKESDHGKSTETVSWTTRTTTGKTTYHTHSLRADNKIEIKFTGLEAPKLDVDWVGSVIVAGKIGDDRSETIVKASNLTTTENGLIRGRTISIEANAVGTAASPGIAASPVRTDLADDVDFDHLLDDHIKESSSSVTIYRGDRVRVGDAHTRGGAAGTVYEYIGAPSLTEKLATLDYTNARWKPVANDAKMNIESKVGVTNIHEVSGDLVIGKITTHGNTWLRAAGGIQPTVMDSLIQLDARSFSETLPVLSLIADSGDIGAKTAPLNILTTWQTSFSATTPGDVVLHSRKDLAVNQIHAGGDVVIKFAPGFTMIDADFIDVRDERAIDVQRTTVWDNLQLTSKPNDPNGFESKLASRIADLEAMKTTEYRTYWDLRDAVKLEPERREELLRLEPDWRKVTNEFRSDYKYTASEAERKVIKDSMHLWTEKQLQNLRGASFAVANFLKTTDTELVIEQPNIFGKSVTIENAYGVGSYDHGQTIALKDSDGKRSKLNLDQRAAIVAAETGDLIFTTQAPVAVLVSVEDNYKLKLEGDTVTQNAPYGGKNTWKELGFEVGQAIMLAGDPGSTTDRGVFYTVKSISQDGKVLEVDAVMTDNATASPVKTRKIGSDNFQPKEFGEYLVAPVIVNASEYDKASHLYVLRREDVDFHSAGKIEIDATNHIFIGSEGDMVLGNIKGSGTVQIKANGDLTRSDSTTQILGNVVLLESANGKIGTKDQRLRIGKNDQAILRAKGDIHAESSDNSNSPLQIKNVFSGAGDVDLKFPGGFVDLCSSDVAIRANKITLATSNSLGDIKGVSCPFTIEGTTINAKAKDINLKSMGNLIVGKKTPSAAGAEGEILPEIEGLFATGNLRLESLGSITVLGTMSAGGEMFVSAMGQLIAIPESQVLSNGPVTLVLHTLAGSSSPAKLDFLGQLKAPLTVIQGSDGPDEFRFAPAASSAGEVQLTIDKVDSMDYGTNWKAGRPTVKDGQFFHVLTSGAQTLRVKNSVRNTNPILPSDVTADGFVSLVDALVVINLLNSGSRPDWLSSDGPMSSEELASFVYYDVNADGRVDPLDVLKIINLLNRREGAAEGEFVANLGRGNDLLIGGSTENQDDLASLDAALADWSSDWASALFDLGDIIDDDDEDDLKGEEGLDMLFGVVGDKVKEDSTHQAPPFAPASQSRIRR